MFEPRQSMFASDRLLVDDGSIIGARLVAKRPFRRGDLILPLTGRLTAASYRTIQIDANTHVEGALLAFMNHSCRPSAAVVVQARAVRALTDLTAGDEVTFFYPSTEWEMVRPFECLCGARNCIRYVAGAKYLALETLANYFIINPHIQRLAHSAHGARSPFDRIWYRGARPTIVNAKLL